MLFVFFFTHLNRLNVYRDCQVPYETDVLESTPPGTVLFDSIIATDRDSVGENLNVTCLSRTSSMTSSTEIIEDHTKPSGTDPCDK